MTTLEKGVIAPATSAPIAAVLETLAPVDRLSIRDIRLRSGADTWPAGRFARTLDVLRDRGLIVRDGVDFYALSVAGRREVNRG